VDFLETADRRTIKHLTDGEELLIDGFGRNVEVLLHTREIGETNVKELDVVIFDVFENFRGVLKHAGGS
jgi:acyl CoA:acetate/3-ketoacid CoA transferase alpha subunit